jgi:hypothetical protein
MNKLLTAGFIAIMVFGLVLVSGCTTTYDDQANASVNASENGSVVATTTLETPVVAATTVEVPVVVPPTAEVPVVTVEVPVVTTIAETNATPTLDLSGVTPIPLTLPNPPEPVVTAVYNTT